jgi:predicted nuclease with TOPRIM domain
MWDWAIWAALVVVVAACAAATALFAVRARTAWRDVDGARREVMDGLDELQASGDAVAEKLAAVDDGNAELQESLGRLNVSLARLAVLRAALDDAQTIFGRFVVVVPHK